MTAIAITHTTEGFALVADGLSWSTDHEDGIRKIHSRNQQKIFGATSGTEAFGWAVTGRVFNGDRTFDLMSEVSDFFAKPSTSVFGVWTDELAARLNAYISEKHDGEAIILERTGDMPNAEEAHTFARLFMAGYFRRGSLPQVAIIRLIHNDGMMVDPQIQVKTPPCDLFSGSEEIAKRYFLDHPADGRFKKYFHSKGKTLSTGIAHAKGFVQACCDPLAEEIDSMCGGIGGHIHVATVTRESGFQWFIPPV